MSPKRRGRCTHWSVANNHGALGPLRRELIPTYQRWANDFGALRTLGALPPGPATFAAETRWFDGQDAGPAKNVTIYRADGRQAIGAAALHHIDARHRNAMLGILIGAPNARGQGCGTAVTRFTLRFAFANLGLHNALLTRASFNRASLRDHAKAGCHDIGHRRACRLLAGELWDGVLMDCRTTELFASETKSDAKGPVRTLHF